MRFMWPGQLFLQALIYDSPPFDATAFLLFFVLIYIMRNFIVLLLFLPVIALAQKKEMGKAITTDGRRIVLFDDGTWKYEINPVAFERGTQVQDTVEDLFQKPVGETYRKSPYNKQEWRSNRTAFSVWFDPKKWKLNLVNLNQPAEASFHLNDASVTVLSERTDIDMEVWVHTAKRHIKQNHLSMVIQHEEWRTVNGQLAYYIKWRSGNRMNFQCYSTFMKGNAEIIQMHAATPVSTTSEAEEHIMRLFTGLMLNEGK
jgi:hypothetical protein